MVKEDAVEKFLVPLNTAALSWVSTTTECSLQPCGPLTSHSTMLVTWLHHLTAFSMKTPLYLLTLVPQKKKRHTSPTDKTYSLSSLSLCVCCNCICIYYTLYQRSADNQPGLNILIHIISSIF